MMWLALFYKEIQQSSIRFAVSLSLITAAFVMMFWLVDQQSPLLFLFGIAIVFFHIFYLFIIWLISFAQEWRNKTHLFWLNLPAGGAYLLSAKMTAGLLQMMLSLAYSMLLAYFLIRRVTLQEITGDPELAQGISEGFSIVQTAYVELAPALYVSVLYGAMYLGFAAVFIFLAAKIIRPLGWLAGIVLTLLLHAGFSSIRSTGIYQTATEWIPVFELDRVFERIAVNTNGERLSGNLETGEALYLGEILAAAGGFALLFVFCVYLFNRHVQA